MKNRLPNIFYRPSFCRPPPDTSEPGENRTNIMTKYVTQRGLQIAIVLNELLAQRICPGSNLEPAAVCVVEGFAGVRLGFRFPI